MKDLEKVFFGELKVMHDGAQRFAEAFAEMEKTAISPEVKHGFAEGKEQAKRHAGRIHDAFDALGQTPEASTCHGMRGIIQEGQLLAGELEGESAVDAGLLAVAEKGVHVAIASHGCLCMWADELGYTRPADLLKQNLGEAKEVCARLRRQAEAAQAREMKGEHELERLFVRQLREIFDGEHLLVKALAEVEFYAVSRLLKLAVHYHLSQTRQHVKNVEEAFAALGETADRRPCDGIEGIIDDAQVAVLEFLGNSALDAALIASAQKAERYEMAAYQNLSRWAGQLRRGQVLELLQENLSEEIATDKKLTLAAEMLINPRARRHEMPKQPHEKAEFLKLATHGT
ncbi:MAG TPA: DUF892 family protein [Candidatus Acidoferrum sp.]|nr:DUF892 family protein [Candidatus Acidoferrum sp.]